MSVAHREVAIAQSIDIKQMVQGLQSIKVSKTGETETAPAYRYCGGCIISFEA
jgi:hypothetical protein